MHRPIRRGRRIAAALAASTAAALALTACGDGSSSSSASGGDTYKVGFVLQLSGPGSVYADNSQAGHKAGIDDVNKNDKAGTKFVSDVADAGADAQSATTACTRLIQQDKVQAIVVFVPGPQLLACNTVAGRRNIPVLSLSSGAGNICAANLTSYGLVPNQQTLPVMDELLSQGKKNWYFFGGDYATPKATIGLAKDYLDKNGGTTVGESYEPTGTADFSQDITAIVNAHPDVAFLNVVGNDDVALQKQWAADPRTQGITRVDILLGEGAAHALGDAAEGIWSSSAYFSSVEGSGNDDFKKQVEALAAAVKKAGTDGAKVIDALKSTKVDGPIGSFQIKDAFSFQSEYLAEAQADGSFTIEKKSDPIEPQLACSH
jgi:urea transport system substrate-binding protein